MVEFVPQVHLQKRGGGEKEDAVEGVVRRRRRRKRRVVVVVVVRRLRCGVFIVAADLGLVKIDQSPVLSLSL